MFIHRSGLNPPSAYLKEFISTFSPLLVRKSTSARTPRKWVGTPCKAVHFSAITASTIDGGSNTSEGYTMQAPCDHAARFPRTRRVHDMKDQIISGFCDVIGNLSKQ